MELLSYLLKSGLVLGLFLTIYSVFLKKETHFQWHRFFLIIGVFLSFGLPLLVLTKVVYLPAPETIQVIPLVNQTLNQETNLLNGSLLIGVFYGIGLMIMSFRFLQQSYSLYKIISKSSATKFENQQYLNTSVKCSPFSFFDYIIIHKKLHTTDELSMILTHENVHSSQYHSLDILLSNVLLIVQWWNPLAWLYKKSMEENLEFIADTETIKEISCPKAYQYTLIKNTATIIQPALATHFYQSLIKKRIIMLNKPTSTSISRWKTILVLPLIALFFWTFNMEAQIKFEQQDQKTTSYVVNPETTNKELKSIEKMIQPNKTKIKFTGIKRNKKKELTQIIIKTRRSLANSFELGMTIGDKHTKRIHPFTLHIDPSSSDIILSSFDDGYTFTTTFVENGTSTVIRNSDSDLTTQKKLFIVDEKEVSSKTFHAIKNDQIKALSILTGSNATDKYGTKGAKGVMEIILNPTKEATNSIPKEVLLVVDDAISTSNNIAPEKIKSMVVLKGKKATDKYGTKGAKGVMEITLKPTKEATNSIPKEVLLVVDDAISTSNNIAPEKIKSMVVLKGKKATDKYGTKGAKGVMEITLKPTKEATNSIPKNVLLVIDGVISTSNNIAPDKIKSIEVLKSKKATDMYGDKAKEGAIIITTKKE